MIYLLIFAGLVCRRIVLCHAMPCHATRKLFLHSLNYKLVILQFKYLKHGCVYFSCLMWGSCAPCSPVGSIEHSQLAMAALPNHAYPFKMSQPDFSLEKEFSLIRLSPKKKGKKATNRKNHPPGHERISKLRADVLFANY